MALTKEQGRECEQQDKYDAEVLAATDDLQHRLAELNCLARQQQDSFVAELRKLQGFLAQTVQANFASREQIEWGYQQDLVKFSLVEEAKTLRLYKEESEKKAIRKQFDLDRAAALQQYQN